MQIAFDIPASLPDRPTHWLIDLLTDRLTDSLIDSLTLFFAEAHPSYFSVEYWVETMQHNAGSSLRVETSWLDKDHRLQQDQLSSNFMYLWSLNQRNSQLLVFSIANSSFLRKQINRELQILQWMIFCCFYTWWMIVFLFITYPCNLNDVIDITKADVEICSFDFQNRIKIFNLWTCCFNLLRVDTFSKQYFLATIINLDVYKQKLLFDHVHHPSDLMDWKLSWFTYWYHLVNNRLWNCERMSRECTQGTASRINRIYARTSLK